MKYFLKLNSIGILLAFFFFIWATLMLNVYRIERIFKIEFNTINLITFASLMTTVLAVPFLLIKVLRKIPKSKVRIFDFSLVVIWFPYFKIIEKIFYYFFPITYRGDLPAPVLGLLLLLGFVLYPIYILIIITFTKI